MSYARYLARRADWTAARVASPIAMPSADSDARSFLVRNPTLSADLAGSDIDVISLDFGQTWTSAQLSSPGKMGRATRRHDD